MVGKTNEDDRGPAPSTPTPPSGGPRKVIKRYSNRKLYDTESSKYVTLDELSEMIKAGDDIQIIDNKSKSDLTSATLAQIIFESEKKQSRMPLDMLRNLIQSSGDAIGDFFDKQVKTPVETARHSAQQTAEEIMQGATELREAATRGMEEFASTARRVFGRASTESDDEHVDALARRYAAAFDEINQRLEIQIREADSTGPQVVEPLIERLSERLESVKEQLSQLHRASLEGLAERNPEAEAEAHEPD